MSQPVLVVKDLIKRFGDLAAVDGLSFTVARGECVGLLGPNGAGKTTTLEILEGLQHPSSGSIQLFGLTWATNERELRNRIGIQLQETRFRDRLRTHEVLRLFRSFYPGGMNVDAALTLTGLHEKRDAQVGDLSGGQRQRLGLAVSLISDPELVFLDEPTTGLDPHARRELWGLIAGLRAQGRTVLLSTHYMEEAEFLCDRLLIVDHGKLVAEGSPRELIASLEISASLDLAVRPTIAPERMLAVEGVTSVEARGPLLHVTVDHVHSALPRILAMLADDRHEVTSLSTQQASLEDVFLKLTGRTFSTADAEVKA